MFGPETRGLPQSAQARVAAENCLFIPMRAKNRSVNLSNAVALVIYEAWRQIGFAEQRLPERRQVLRPHPRRPAIQEKHRQHEHAAPDPNGSVIGKLIANQGQRKVLA